MASQAGHANPLASMDFGQASHLAHDADLRAIIQPQLDCGRGLPATATSWNRICDRYNCRFRREGRLITVGKGGPSEPRIPPPA
jgi:hypothetical protein